MTPTKAIKGIIGKSLERQATNLEESVSKLLDVVELLDLGDLAELLIHENDHFPTLEISDFLKFKCQKLMDNGELQRAAFYLLHSQALAFRHQMVSQYSRRIGRNATDLLEEDLEPVHALTDEIQKKSISFASWTSEDLSKISELLSKFPKDWRIVQVSTQPNTYAKFKKNPGDKAIEESNMSLIVSMFECGSEESDKIPMLMQKVAKLTHVNRSTITKEMQNILQDQTVVHANTKGKKKVEGINSLRYKEAKEDLDARLETLLGTIENKWIGLAKLLFLGKPQCDLHQKRIQSLLEKLKNQLNLDLTPEAELLLEILLDGSSLLTANQIRNACLQITDKKAVVSKLSLYVNEFGTHHPADEIKRGPVVLILDKEIQMLPWEFMPSFRKNPFSRVPSIFFLSALYETHQLNKNSVTNVGVNRDNVYYVLNPDKNLENTQNRLEKAFRGYLGKGVTGKWPSSEDLVSVLSEKDAYIYCGHGVRQRHLNSQEVESLRVRGVLLMFGCSSGKLERLGRSLDPIGYASSYLMATTPCMLGFLWVVTDKDIDEWTLGFLKCWLGIGDIPPEERDFVKAVALGREKFSRKLNGAAAVVYGLPSFLQ